VFETPWEIWGCSLEQIEIPPPVLEQLIVAEAVGDIPPLPRDPRVKLRLEMGLLPPIRSAGPFYSIRVGEQACVSVGQGATVLSCILVKWPPPGAEITATSTPYPGINPPWNARFPADDCVREAQKHETPSP